MKPVTNIDAIERKAKARTSPTDQNLFLKKDQTVSWADSSLYSLILSSAMRSCVKMAEAEINRITDFY